MKPSSPLFSGRDPFLSFGRMNDSELWSAFLTGDKGAFSFIYEKYADELFSYGMKVKPHRSLVKDCMHDLFVELWNRRTHLSPTSNIKFYLYRSLRRKIRHQVERERSLFRDEPYEHLAELGVSQPFEQSVIRQQAEEERKLRVLKIMSRLSDRQQEVIRLIFFEQMSYEEVSEIMCINVRSVYTLAWKAIAAIRKHLSVLLVLLVSLFL